ncbi:type II toxin-antitoxin system PemK/MazF family toxin [Spirosoma knui]
MNQGDIVLIPFPFTDLTGNKVRPAVVLMSALADVTLAFITTQLHWQEPADVVIVPTVINGLKKPSLIRLSKLATIDKALLLGRLGALDATELTTVKQNLRLLFQL